jgi:CRISPR-associated endoribonuclease Cas6
LERVDPATVRWRSSNGDVVDCTGASLRTDTFPLAPNQEEITVAFASPFLIALRGEKNKAYARGLEGLDLSAAFSAGLSRRFERQILIEVRPDPLSARIDGSKPVLVRVRKSAGRDLILPALSVDLTLRGSNADLCCAYFGGLGEKTRYGFGCVVALD